MPTKSVLSADPESGMRWLSSRMAAVGLNSLDDLQQASGINKGTLSKYFRGVQVPSVAVVPTLCNALKVSPEELLIGLGIIPSQKS
jgi:transcriptional regulator with XRE-family HTH domain